MSRPRAAERCSDALSIVDALLADEPTPETVRDLIAVAGLLEEALEDLEPSGHVAALFLGVPA
jgi:hypothetical protein